MLFASLLLLPLVSPFAQLEDVSLPTGVVATWNGGQIDSTRFERFLGRSFRGKKVGQDALVHILQVQMVQKEAAVRGLQTTPTELASRMAFIHQEAEDAGVDLIKLVKSRRISMAEFEALVRDSILHEKLVRIDQNLPDNADLTPEALQNWSDAKSKDLLADASNAPAGFALDSPPFVITEAELGKVVHEILPDSRLLEYVEQLALQSYLPQWAIAQGLLLTDDVLEAEIRWRQRRVAENPAYGGATYEGLLASQGATVESVRQGAELKTAAYLRLYASISCNDEWFQNLSETMRQRFQAEFGEHRKVSWLLLRAVEEKQDEIDFDFKDAAEELNRYAEDIHSVADFAELAEKYSEDEITRKVSGQLGWVNQLGIGTDPAFAQAAFSAEEHTVFGPVRTKQGQALGWIHQVRPAPNEKEFKQAVRRGMHKQLRKQVFVEMGFRCRYEDPLAGIPTAGPEILR